MIYIAFLLHSPLIPYSSSYLWRHFFYILLFFSFLSYVAPLFVRAELRSLSRAQKTTQLSFPPSHSLSRIPLLSVENLVRREEKEKEKRMEEDKRNTVGERKKERRRRRQRWEGRDCRSPIGLPSDRVSFRQFSTKERGELSNLGSQSTLLIKTKRKGRIGIGF